MSRSTMWRPRPATALTSGLCLVLAGIALLTVSRSFDGFVQGCLLGAGLVLTLIGVLTLSPLIRRRGRS